MANESWALLVYDLDPPVGELEGILTSRGMRTRHSHNCFQARAVLREAMLPGLVLTGVSLPDGTWEDVLDAARAAPAKPPVIVVTRLADMKLYLDVLERGAHDFIVPPFSSSDMTYIIRAAILKGRERARDAADIPL